MSESVRLGPLVSSATLVLAFAAAPARAQNLVANPHFHHDVASWTLFEGTSLQWTDLADEGDCPGSGIALATSEPTAVDHTATVMQCVEVASGSEVFAAVRHLGYGTFTLRLSSYTTTGCSGGILVSALTSTLQNPTTWSTTKLALFPPKLEREGEVTEGSVHSVRLVAIAKDDEPHGLSLDAVHLAYREPLFLDGFEGNAAGATAPCRWAPP